MNKILLFLISCSVFILCGCSAASGDPQEAQEAVAETCAAITDTSEDAAQMPAMAEESASTTMSAYSEERTPSVSGTADVGMNFFSFHEWSQTYTDEDGGELLKELLTEPVFYATDSSLQTWVGGVTEEIYASDLQFGQDLLSYAREDRKKAGDLFYCYSHYVSMEVRRHDDAVISLLSLSSAYSGGKYPNSVQTAYNLDLNNRKVLRLEDVIYQDQEAALSELVQSAVDAKFSSLGNDILYEDYVQTVANAMEYGNMTPYWYFTEKGLVVFFNQYELGSYAAGIIRAYVAYEDLSGILREEYMPQSHKGTVTEVSLTREPEQGEWIYYVDLSPGETIYISISGTAYHVQLSEVFYVEQTSVNESVLFSANRLDDAATIAVTADPNRTYTVEYYDEQGGPYLVYVQGTDVLEEISEG